MTFECINHNIFLDWFTHLCRPDSGLLLGGGSTVTPERPFVMFRETARRDGGATGPIRQTV